MLANHICAVQNRSAFIWCSHRTHAHDHKSQIIIWLWEFVDYYSIKWCALSDHSGYLSMTKQIYTEMFLPNTLASSCIYNHPSDWFHSLISVLKSEKTMIPCSGGELTKISISSRKENNLMLKLLYCNIKEHEGVRFTHRCCLWRILCCPAHLVMICQRMTDISQSLYLSNQA